MAFGDTATPDDGGENEALGRNFLRKLGRVAAQIPFAEDLLTVYYCALDLDTPRHVKLMLLGAIAYFVMPADAIPDMLPILGFTDDAAVVAGTIKLVTDHIRPEHRDSAKRQLTQMRAQN